MTRNPHIGSSFDDFLKEEGLSEATHEIATERLAAWQIVREAEENEGSKTEIEEPGFSRSSGSNRERTGEALPRGMLEAEPPQA